MRQQEITPHRLHINRAVVWYNPAATRAVQSKRRIKELETLFPGNVHILYTSPEGREANLETLHKAAHLLGPHTLLAIAAGDGTVNLAVEALATTHQELGLPKLARRSPILPLWGGNANDLAYMLNGFSWRRRIKTVLSKADIVPIYPLTCAITTQSTTYHRMASSYISFGASAMTAYRMNDKQYRLMNRGRPKFFLELLFVIRSFAHAPSFTVSEAGHTHKIHELLFANGSRIAKVDGLPARLSERAYYREILEQHRLTSTLGEIVNLLRGGRAANFQDAPVKLTIRDQVWAQFDGEPLLVEAGSTIEIRLADQPFYAVASALRTPRVQGKPRTNVHRVASHYRQSLSSITVSRNKD